MSGYSSGGVYEDFDWAWDRTELKVLKVRVEWNPVAPTTERLGVLVDLYEDVFIGDQPSVSGPSPIEISLRLGDEARLVDEPKLHLGASRESSGLPVTYNDTVIEQRVNVTIQEVYRCSETRHP
jgi:hypothetical protein